MTGLQNFCSLTTVGREEKERGRIKEIRESEGNWTSK